MRVVSIDYRSHTMQVGNEKIDTDLPDKELQRNFYEAFTKLEDKDRYIAALEILVDNFVNKAFPACLSFIVPQQINENGAPASS